MPIEPFDFTYDLNSQSAQNTVLDALNKGREIPIVPISHFFTELLPNPTPPFQTQNDSFGPVLSDPTNQFRVTSVFTLQNTTDTVKAFAATNGHLFFAPHGNPSGTKVNIILKPSQALDVGVKIKYFVYRGVLKSNIMVDNSGITQLINQDSNNLSFINRVWDEYKEYNNLNNVTSPISFKAKDLGYDPSVPSDSKLIKRFFNKENNADSVSSYNLPYIKVGEPLGFFEGTVGFEVVVDYGDYEHEFHDSGFELDFAYASATECILNIAATNPLNVAGNMPSIPLAITDKIFRENIYQFIDPAAFYGAHLTKNFDGRKAQYVGRVQYFNAATNHEDDFSTPKSIYESIISLFYNRNRHYLYILGKRGRSYNFYNETPYVPNEGPVPFGPIRPGNSQSAIPPQAEEDFKTNNWPFKILDVNYMFFDAVNDNNGGNIPDHDRFTNTFSFFLKSFQNGLPNLFYSNDAFNSVEFKILDQTRGVDLQKSAYKANDLSTTAIIPVSSFIFANYQRDLNFSEYYNDFFGPINLDPIFEQNDFETANAQNIQWVNYIKPKLFFLGDNGLVGQMKIVFEGTPPAVATNTTPATVDTRKRLYVISPILKKSNTELMTNNQFNNAAQNSKLTKKDQFVSGLGIIDSTKSFMDKVYGTDKSRSSEENLQIWKGKVNDGGQTIAVLVLRSLEEDENVKNCIQIGLTQINYDSLFVGIPDQVYFNPYFHLVEVVDPVDTPPKPFAKYQLGLRYDDPSGTERTYMKTGSDLVYVYSIDDKFFTTKEYAAQFNYAETFPDISVDFRPLQNFDGEFGFDWLRKGDIDWVQNGIAINERPFNTIVGDNFTDNTFQTLQSDVNQFVLFFLSNSQMYNRMKVNEYNSFPTGISINADLDITNYDTDFSISYLNLYKKDTVSAFANLRMLVRVKQQPDNLYIKYPFDYFNITFPDIPASQVKVKLHDKNKKLYETTLPISAIPSNETKNFISINIENKNNLPEDANIIVYIKDINGNEKMCGLLKVCANDRAHRKTIRFQPVKVTDSFQTTLPDGTLSNTSFVKNKNFVRKFLNQALIDPVFLPEITINLAGDPNFTGYMPITPISGNNYQLMISPFPQAGIPATPFATLLKNKIDQVLGGNAANLSNVFKMVFFARAANGGTKGRTVPGDNIIYLTSDGAFETEAHEALHSLGVTHVFTNQIADSKAIYTFDISQTDNLMDYFSIGIRGTYKWQWQLARVNAEIEPVGYQSI